MTVDLHYRAKRHIGEHSNGHSNRYLNRHNLTISRPISVIFVVGRVEKVIKGAMAVRIGTGIMRFSGII